MPNLLEIPREIRDNILDTVVEVVLEDFPGVGRKLFDYNIESWYPGSNIRYSNFVRTDITPSLLVNRQLNEETMEAVRRIREPANYSLEVIIYEELELRVKWLAVPVLTTQVDTVRATIFSQGVCQRGCSMFREENGGLPIGTWALCSLIDRFLRVGPVGSENPTSQKPDMGISIRHLILDIRTPDVPEYMIASQHERIDTYDQLCRLRAQTGIDYIMPPEVLAQFFHQYLSMLCRFITSYGSILYERIGRIELLIDGKAYKHFDFAERIASLNKIRRSAVHVEKLRIWREEIYKNRTKCGLQV